jgi:hypothetical protein
MCAERDLVPSQVVRRLIRQWIVENAGERRLPDWLTKAASSSQADR